MGGTNTRRVRRLRETITLPVVTDWVLVELGILGRTGRIGRIILRAPAASTVTGAELRIYQGEYDSAQDPALVPAEDLVFEERFGPIAIVGHATDSDYDTELKTTDQEGLYNVEKDADSLWLAIQSQAATGAQASVVVSVTSFDSH